MEIIPKVAIQKCGLRQNIQVVYIDDEDYLMDDTVALMGFYNEPIFNPTMKVED